MKQGIIDELRRISDSIPKELLERSMKMDYIFSRDLKKKLQDLTKDKTHKASARKKLKTIIDSGAFDKQEMKEDTTVTDEIDAYIEKEIERSIKMGRLPKPSKSKMAVYKGSIKNKYEKGKGEGVSGEKPDTTSGA